MAILKDLRDPRIQDVTVTYVEVSPDMRQAKVHVSVMGDEAKQRLSLHGLQSAAGFLQSKISDRIDTRYTPRLQFVLDMGVKKSLAISRLLHDLLPEEDQAEKDQAEEDQAIDEDSPPDDLPPDEVFGDPPDGTQTS